MTARLIRLSSRPLRLAILAVVAVAVMLSAAASARADGSDITHVSVSFDGHLRAVATFYSPGDWLEIEDKRSDNLPVAVRYSYIRKNGTTQRGTHWHTAGKTGFGNSFVDGQVFPGQSFGNHNFGEGRTVWFQACVRHRGGALTCGKTEKATA